MQSTGALRNLSFLILDDNQPMLEILRAILKSYGVSKIVAARDVVVAFDLIRHEEIDIAIVDYNLAYLSGLDFARLIRTAEDSPNPFLPIIMLSAYADMPRISAARDTGVTEFCVKPVSAQQLARKINHVVLKPRDFVRTNGFFGPDRRRRSEGFHGSERRRRDHLV